MSPKHTYFGFTTAQQRKLLFEEWEATGSVAKASQRARVSRGVYYYWKPRFAKYGYAGLEEFGSRVAHKLNRKEEAIEQRVIELGRENPDWGKTRISQEMAKAQWRKTRYDFQTLSKTERQDQKASYEATQQSWQLLRQQRRENLENRNQENQAWHQHNQALNTKSTSATIETRTWIAILVVTDNCTRQCLG